MAQDWSMIPWQIRITQSPKRIEEEKRRRVGQANRGRDVYEMREIAYDYMEGYKKDELRRKYGISYKRLLKVLRFYGCIA